MRTKALHENEFFNQGYQCRCYSKLLLSFMLLSFFVACSEALPSQAPACISKESLQAATQAASRAEAAANQAHRELERAQTLYTDAQELTNIAEEAKKRCEFLARNIPTPKKKKVYRVPSRGPSSINSPVSPDQPTIEKKAVPEYSKSDAPIEEKH